MAYILKISPATKKEHNNLDDVVSIQDTPPSIKERTLFTVDEVAASAETLLLARDAAMPEIKLVWLDGDDYREIVKMPVYKTRYVDGEFVHTVADKVENRTSVATKVKNSTIIRGRVL